MYGDLSCVAGWPEMDNPDRIKASRPESPLPLYFSTWGPKWLPLTSGPGLIISRPVSLFVGRFSLSTLPLPPTSVLLRKGRGGGGWNVSLGGWKLFSRSCGRRVPLNHCLPRSTLEMSETAITWTLHVFCQNLLIKVHRPDWERKRPVKFDLSHLQNLVLVPSCIVYAIENSIILFFEFMLIIVLINLVEMFKVSSSSFRILLKLMILKLLVENLF